MTKRSEELRRIHKEALDIARQTRRSLNSVHYLLAMFCTPFLAREVLTEAGVNEERVIRAFRVFKNRIEDLTVLQQVHSSAEALGSHCKIETVDSMLLLASLLKVQRSFAAGVLRSAGIDVTALRNRVIGQLNQRVDRLSSSTIRIWNSSSTQIPSVKESVEPMVQPATPTRPVVPRGQLSPTPKPPMSAHPTKPPVSAPPSKPTILGTLGQVTRPPADGLVPPAGGAPVAPPLSATNRPRLGRFALDPQRYPTLTEFGKNLSALAALGGMTPLIGREEIVDQVIEVLSMKRANNPCLVGEAGVGKTAIVEGLAARIAGNTKRYGRLGNAIIVELHLSTILAGTSFRGAFAERMKKLRSEVAAAEGSIIVFIDEVHTIMGAGAGDGALDAANDLKTAMARGCFPLIGATTRDEYVRYIEKDAALERRFQVIDVPEPTKNEALKILSGIAPTYVEHHGLPYSHEAIESAVLLSQRFITDRQLPDKAIGILDRAGAQAKTRQKKIVERDDIARAVAQQTKVPMARLLADERSRIRDLGKEICASIVGQQRAVAKMTRRIRRNYAGFSGARPLASFVFAGPPGVGKTETARVLARALFLVDDALVTFDMNEFSDPASLNRLVGSPPGYVGHQQRGLLSEAMYKRPYRVLLFEHVERAAAEVLGLIGQILATGRLTDNHGRLLDMRNAVVVLTSNKGTDAMLSGTAKRVIGFASPPRPVDLTKDDEARLTNHISAQVSKEICGAVDDLVLFRPLDDIAGRAVAQMTIDEKLAQLYEDRLIEVTADASVVDLITAKGGVDPATGARALQGLVDNVVLDFLSEKILEGRLRTGSKVTLLATPNGLHLAESEPSEPDASPRWTERVQKAQA